MTYNIYHELAQFMPDQESRGDFPDMWRCAEERIRMTPPELLQQLILDIDSFFQDFSTVDCRRNAFHLHNEFSPHGLDFDAWLQDVRRRAQQASRGDHSQPLTVPEPYPE